MIASSAPSRRAVRAASIAVLPPPYTTTRRPSCGALLGLHAAEQRDRVEDLRSRAGGDVGALAEVRTDGEEDGVEPARPHLVEDARHGAVQLHVDTEVDDALDLGVENVAGEPVRGDPEAHHPARPRPGVVDRHRVAETDEVVGGGEARRPRSDRPGRASPTAVQ